MTGDPHDHDHQDQDQPAEPEPADEPEDEDEPAHRPGRADQLAALTTLRAVLTGDDPGAHDAAASGACPACTAIAVAAFAAAFQSTLAGDTVLVGEPTRRVMLAAVEAAEAELRAAWN